MQWFPCLTAAEMFSGLLVRPLLVSVSCKRLCIPLVSFFNRCWRVQWLPYSIAAGRPRHVQWFPCSTAAGSSAVSLFDSCCVQRFCASKPVNMTISKLRVLCMGSRPLRGCFALWSTIPWQHRMSPCMLRVVQAILIQSDLMCTLGSTCAFALD